MANWLERARHELAGIGVSSAAETDETSLSAVLAGAGTGESRFFGANKRVSSSGCSEVGSETSSQGACFFDPPDEPPKNRDTAESASAVAAENVLTKVNRFDDADEATEERAAILEYEGGLTRSTAEEVAAAAAVYYRHIFGPGKARGCCCAPAERFCDDAKRLRDAYFTAAREADGRRHPRH